MANENNKEFQNRRVLNNREAAQVAGGGDRYGSMKVIAGLCRGDSCHVCCDVCPHDMVYMENGVAHIRSDCIGCGWCEDRCPTGAIVNE